MIIIFLCEYKGTAHYKRVSLYHLMVHLSEPSPNSTGFWNVAIKLVIALDDITFCVCIKTAGTFLIVLEFTRYLLLRITD